MSNKETLQSKNARLNNNNISLSDILNTINNLPEAGGTTEDLSEELTSQSTLLGSQTITVNDLKTALAGKISGGGTEQARITNAIIERTLTGDYVNNEITKIGGNSLRSLPISSLHCENVTKVEGEAIRQCPNLETVYLPKCTSLASYSLGICSKLKRVELGAATSIAGYSFYQCSALTTLIIRNTSSVCSLGNVNAFTSSGVANGTGYIYVPDNLVDSYKTATNWSTYANQIRSITTIE